MKPSSSLRFPLLPAVIFLFALALRLWGIAWALPDASRAFSFHPDESIVVGASLRVNPLLLLLDPGFYNYGSLSLLLNGFFIHLGEGVGLVRPGIAPGVPSAGALLTARLVTAFLGAGTCPLLYAAGRRLYGSPAGIVAAGLYAVSPLAVQHGHFATVDVPATFFVAGAIYFAAAYFADSGANPRSLLWCGLWAGLAAATKYNAGLVLLAGVAAWQIVSVTRTLKGIAGLIGMAALGFLLGCPGVLLNTSAFIRDFLFEANHVRTGSGNIFVNTPSGFLYHPLYNLPWAVGGLTALAILAGVIYAVYRRRPADAPLAAFALSYFLVIGLAEVKFARYLLPLLPPLLLWVGGLLPQALSHKAFHRIAAVLTVCGAFGLFVALSFDAVMMQTDTRDLAAAAIRKSQTEGKVTSVGFATGPWFYSPTLHPFLSVPIPARAKEAAATLENLRLIPADSEWNLHQLISENPDVVALSEYEYADAQRIGDPDALAYLSETQRRFPRKTIFFQPISLFGIPVTRQNTNRGLPMQRLPHDMMYANPITVVLEK